MSARDNVFAERDLLHLEAASRVDIADLNKRINAMKQSIEKVSTHVDCGESKYKNADNQCAENGR